MLRTVLSFFSILFLGTVGVFLYSVYSNLSMAQWEISRGKPVEINWSIPRLGIVVEYNNYSFAEEVPQKVTVLPPVIVEEEIIEKIYRNPDIVEVEKTVIGDDVNGEELVDHYGFPIPDVENIRTIDLKNYVDDLHLERMLAEFDRKKLLKEEKREYSNKAQDSSLKEMVFIDYSKKQKPPLKPKKKAVALLAPKNSPTPALRVKKQFVKANPKKDSFSPFLAIASDFAKKKLFQRTLRVKSAVGGHDLDFQFVPDHNKESILYSDQKNLVKIFPEKELAGGILRGRIVSPNYIRTIVNLPISEKVEVKFEIPLIGEETFEKYRERNEESDGGFLLVRLFKKVEDVDIDNDYSFRIFLDEEFREVSQEDGYSYILFMGIHPGVTILSYLLRDGEIAEKPIYISADEILYDSSVVKKAGYETFELFQKNLFSSERRELALGEKEIQYFNRDTFPLKKGLNYYDIKTPPVPRGARNYLKLGHLDGTLYVGYKANRQLEIPNQDFIESIMEGFDIDDLSGACLLQLNFSKSILHLGLNLNTTRDSDDFDLIYLNKDGTFEEEPSLKTEKVFILGESPGVFSGGIEYANRQQEFFKSFCSLGSYLIEQF